MACLHGCTFSFCWFASSCTVPPAQVELQGVSLVVLSFFRDLDAATELANTVAAAGGIMGAAVCCAENGGDPNDDWTTCDRDRDLLLDRSPFEFFYMNIFPVTTPMQRTGRAVHAEPSKSKLNRHAILCSQLSHLASSSAAIGAAGKVHACRRSQKNTHWRAASAWFLLPSWKQLQAENELCS